MVFCVHATATLHATDAAISVRCASKEARSCNFCSQWFSVTVCMPRQGSMQQMRQYQVCKQTTLAQKRYAAAIFVMLDHLFACHGYIPCDRYDNVSCKCRYDNVSCKFGGGWVHRSSKIFVAMVLPRMNSSTRLKFSRIKYWPNVESPPVC